jgi:hypothetical protein
VRYEVSGVVSERIEQRGTTDGCHVMYVMLTVNRVERSTENECIYI